MVIIISSITLSSSLIALAEVSVGVKSGDWMVYDMEFTGTPPFETYPIEFEIEVLSVSGTSLNLRVSNKFSNGNNKTHMVTIDLETGGVELILIQANLKKGDSFFEGEDLEITIGSVEEKKYAGAKRTYVSATVPQLNAEFYWDKETGILLEASLSETDFTENVKLRKTNIWKTQTLGLPIDPLLVYALIIAAVAIAVILALIYLRGKKARTMLENEL
jgi:hypothetical protein